jgi:hypothetical protein
MKKRVLSYDQELKLGWESSDRDDPPFFQYFIATNPSTRVALSDEGPLRG